MWPDAFIPGSILPCNINNNVDSQTIYRDLTWFKLFVLIFMYIGSFAICYYNNIPIANLAAIFTGIPSLAVIPSFLLMLASNNQYKYDQFQQTMEAVQYNGQQFSNPDSDRDIITPKWRYLGVRYIRMTLAPILVYYFLEITLTIMTAMIVKVPESPAESVEKINNLVNCAYALAVIEGLTLVTSFHINYTYGVPVKVMHFVNFGITLVGFTTFVVINPGANIAALGILAVYPPLTMITNNRGI